MDITIPLFKVYMREEVPDQVRGVLMSGYIGQGPRVDQFEEVLEHRFGRPALTICSGTAALDLALHLCGVGPGDQVITTAQTCTATNGVIVRRGATPVFCDVNKWNGNLDPIDVSKNINDHVKAIMAVDWGGRSCDYAALKSFGIPVIEDAAHAVGTTIDGHHVASGVGGDYVCFSFQAIKHLTTVDGGAICVPDHQLDRARLLRWYGLDRRGSKSFRCEQNIEEVGYKYHMNDVAATIGIANAVGLDDILERHRSNAKTLCLELGGMNGIIEPKWDPESSWWIYTILVDDVEDFSSKMKDLGIDTSPVHARNDKHDAFRNSSIASPNLAGLDHFSKHQVAIPVGWWLSSSDMDRVIDATIRSARR